MITSNHAAELIDFMLAKLMMYLGGAVVGACMLAVVFSSFGHFVWIEKQIPRRRPVDNFSRWIWSTRLLKIGWTPSEWFVINSGSGSTEPSNMHPCQRGT